MIVNFSWGTERLKLPSSPLTTPFVGFSFTMMEAPIISSPVFESLILPLISLAFAPNDNSRSKLIAAFNFIKNV